MLNTEYIYISISYYTTLSVFVNGWTSDSTAASVSGGIAPLRLERSGLLSSLATDLLTDETTSGTGRKRPASP